MSTPESKRRALEKTIEIFATPEEVWHAITDAQELTRWFPLDARVKPGVGGEIFVSWGSDFSGTERIEIWEPNQHLRLVRDAGNDESGTPVELATDYDIQASGSHTILRLVQSGFGRGASWDESFEAHRRGWNFELGGLKLYLERHMGQDRQVVWSRRTIDKSPAQFWPRLLRQLGVEASQLSTLGTDTELHLKMAGADYLEAKVMICGPPQDLAAVVSNLNDAYLRIRIDSSCSQNGKTEVNLWISLYDQTASICAGLQAAADQLLERVPVEE